MIIYHLARSGLSLGTFDEATLNAMAARGELRPDDMLWHESLSNWEPAARVIPRLFVPRPTVPPPLPQVVFGNATPRVPSMRVGPPERSDARGSSTWRWVLIGAAVGLVLLLGVGFAGLSIYWAGARSSNSNGGASRSSPALIQPSLVPLFEERKGHQPQWRASSYKADGPADVPPKELFELIHYTSPAGRLAAYVTPNPGDGKRHPAMVWAHGGFGGIGDFFWSAQAKRNDQSARAFREAGIVLMAPSWRGENDNPGRFELFYGEIEDMLAAVEYVKTLPYVDPERVYIGGHSTGGTVTLLSAVASDKFRAAFSLGGMPDGEAVLGDGKGYGNIPYNPRSRLDHQLRSAIRYTQFIKRPTFYFEGQRSAYTAAAAAMQARAKLTGAPFHAFDMPGDHFDILHPLTHLIARKILADTGPKCSITITEAEAKQAYGDAFAANVAEALRGWIKEGGDLSKALADLEDDDGEVSTPEDAKAVRDAWSKLSTSPPSAENAMAMSTLLRIKIADNPALRRSGAQLPFEDAARWLLRRLDAPATGDEAKALLVVLDAVVRGKSKESAKLVQRALQVPLAPKDYGWSMVMSEFDSDHRATTEVMNYLHEHLPDDRIGTAALSAANQLGLSGWTGRHPFDSDAGAALLQKLLTDAEHDSDHATDAALALAFISADRRAKLLPAALKHPDELVRMEAAWADLKTGGAEGLAALKHACLDPRVSRRAEEYLKELEHEKDIPAATSEPSFRARSEMAGWLMHPNEYGMPPKTIEVFDHRTLFWPPTNDRREVWLLKFTMPGGDEGDKTGYGMVGSMTWSSFDEDESPPKPEELYVKHCAIELGWRASKQGDKRGPKEREPDARSALAKGNPGMFGDR